MKTEKERWARRGTYSLVMGVAAFFAFFNSTHQWVEPPEYNRIKGIWLEPFFPTIEPYLPTIVLVLGTSFLAAAAYCTWRYIIAARSGGSAA
ncbi:MAG: hypothetical protein J0L89_05740 [Xanthomonadales bacterium]|nr:hypothetical protein [Xanthomonadales bacterium]